MPEYRYAGAFETVLNGLVNGGNARLRRYVDDARVDPEQPAGSTVVAQPGDVITTDEPYPNAWMVNTATGEPDPEPESSESAADGPAHPETPAASESPASDEQAPGTAPVVDDVI